MGEPTDDEPNASSPTSAPRGDSIAAAASRALRAKKAAPAEADAPAAATAPAKPAQPAQRVKAAKPAASATTTKPAKSAAKASTKTATAKTATAKTASAKTASAKTVTESAEKTAAKTSGKTPRKSIDKPVQETAEKPVADEPGANQVPTAVTPQPIAGEAPTAAGRSGWLSGTAVLIYALVAALLAATAIITGVVAARTKPNSDIAYAQARDAVVVDATTDIIILNSLDYRTAATGINKWLDVSTGTLHDQVVAQKTAIVTDVQQAKVITTAKVLAIAVSQLDDRSGSATVLASVEQTVAPAGKSAAKKYDRFSASLTLIDGSWKLSDFGLVAV